MIFVVLVVLIRRGNAKDVDWEEDFEEPFEDEEQETTAPKEEDIQESAKDTETPQDATQSGPELSDELRQQLATKAGQVGVMQQLLEQIKVKRAGMLMQALNCNTGTLVVMVPGPEFR